MAALAAGVPGAEAREYWEPYSPELKLVASTQNPSSFMKWKLRAALRAGEKLST
jgi:hypothetical protein